jgi:hypothetical protein
MSAWLVLLLVYYLVDVLPDEELQAQLTTRKVCANVSFTDISDP